MFKRRVYTHNPSLSNTVCFCVHLVFAFLIRNTTEKKRKAVHASHELQEQLFDPFIFCRARVETRWFMIDNSISFYENLMKVKLFEH